MAAVQNLVSRFDEPFRNYCLACAGGAINMNSFIFKSEQEKVLSEMNERIGSNSIHFGNM